MIMKVIEVKKIELTEEEKEILNKATDILQDIHSEIADTLIESYENSEYVTQILDIPFEHWD